MDRWWNELRAFCNITAACGNVNSRKMRAVAWGLLILNASCLARFLAAFVENQNIIKQLEDCGNVTVMQRVSSKVDWHEAFRSRFETRSSDHGQVVIHVR